MNTFNPGDVVKQVHTGLEMEVREYSRDGKHVLCEWLDKDTDHQEAYFMPVNLTLVKAAQVRPGERITTDADHHIKS